MSYQTEPEEAFEYWADTLGHKSILPVSDLWQPL